jgi:trans-2,3-dihydro-3-hydroxyanthranilate isomerase
MANEDHAHGASLETHAGHGTVRVVRRLRYVVADVFTDSALGGNPLAVFTDARDLDPVTMQRLARETNLSETTFVLPPQAEGADVRIRIFTPQAELPFAGHPTLGSAFVLGGPLQAMLLRLETGAGVVPVELQREGPRIVFGWMEQPVPTWSPFAAEGELLAALGLSASTEPVELYDNGMQNVMVGVPTAEELAALEPDFNALARVNDRGTGVFAPRDGGWKVRMFAPALGVPEDPATGSAAGPVAVHLARHGRIAFGEEIVLEQGAEIGRPSTLHAQADGSGDAIESVRVGGSAVIVARGEFAIP